MDTDTDTLLILIGQKIQTLRENRGLSQLELASEIDLSKTHLGRIERAESNITVKSLNKLANFFEVDITYFFKTD